MGAGPGPPEPGPEVDTTGCIGEPEREVGGDVGRRWGIVKCCCCCWAWWWNVGCISRKGHTAFGGRAAGVRNGLRSRSGRGAYRRALEGECDVSMAVWEMRGVRRGCGKQWGNNLVMKQAEGWKGKKRCPLCADGRFGGLAQKKGGTARQPLRNRRLGGCHSRQRRIGQAGHDTTRAGRQSTVPLCRCRNLNFASQVVLRFRGIIARFLLFLYFFKNLKNYLVSIKSRRDKKEIMALFSHPETLPCHKKKKLYLQRFSF